MHAGSLPSPRTQKKKHSSSGCARARTEDLRSAALSQCLREDGAIRTGPESDPSVGH
jgi:hypothetical protein